MRGKAHPRISLGSHHKPLALQHNADAATSTTRHHNKHKRFVRTQLARTLSPLCTHSSRAPMSRATLALPVAGDRQPSASPAGPHQLSRNFWPTSAENSHSAAQQVRLVAGRSSCSSLPAHLAVVPLCIASTLSSPLPVPHPTAQWREASLAQPAVRIQKRHDTAAAAHPHSRGGRTRVWQRGVRGSA